MDEFGAGVRDLHARVGQLDALLQERSVVADLADRRADAAHEQAERAQGLVARNSARIRRLFAAGLVAAFVWTPFTAYGAVWMHERVRNHCYPGATIANYPEPDAEPWYCDIFPGTGRPHD